ncbi:MAG: hypothetical protein WC956_06045, partial [bacterium]
MSDVRKTTDASTAEQRDVAAQAEVPVTAGPNEQGVDVAIDSYEQPAQNAPPASTADGAPKSILTASVPNGIGEPAEIARRLTLREIDGLINDQAAKIKGRDQLATNRKQEEARKVLSEAIDNLRWRFKPERTRTNHLPSQNEIAASLKVALNIVHRDMGSVGDLDAGDLLPLFAELVKKNAAGLRFLGRKDNSRGEGSRSADNKSAPSPAHAAWQARFDALPKQTSDGRTHVRYGGTGMSEFLAKMPLPHAGRDREKFEFEFYNATGITFSAFSNWGSIRRPPARTERERIKKVWEALIDQAIEENRIEGFLQSHRPASVGSAAAWNDRIAVAGYHGRQRELGLEIAPQGISSGDWKLFIDFHVRHDRIEDVSVEPGKDASLKAIVPAYLFLKNRLHDKGMAIDLWDFLAAIYPVVRRIVLNADADGIMRLDLPEKIVGELDPKNLGYSTFAQNVLQKQIVTGVLPGTISGHARGTVEHPEFATIRQYVKPLSLASSATAEQEQNLYFLLAGVFRILPILDKLDPQSGARPADTRLNLVFGNDPTQYATASRHYLGGQEREIEGKVRKGYYDALLSLAREQLAHYEELARIPGISAVRTSLADGSMPPLDLLKSRLAPFEERAREFRDSALRVAGATQHPQEAIRGFYRGLQAESEELIFLTQTTGRLKTPMGNLGFVTAQRRAQQHFDTRSIAVLYIDDLISRARDEKWNDDARLQAAIKLRVIVGNPNLHNLLRPEERTGPHALADAARPYWDSDEQSLQNAAQDVARLETEALPPDVSGRPPAVYENGERMRMEIMERGPALPHRRLAPPWREQWMAHAAENGLKPLAAELALAAMTEYFQSARGFLIDFNDQQLTRAIEGAFAKEILHVDHRVKRAILSFFPTVGVAAEVNSLDAAGARQAELADRAFNAYIDALPREKGADAQVRIDVGLLRDFVAEVHAGDPLARPQTVLALALARLQAFNSRRNAAAVSTDDGKQLPDSGLSGIMPADETLELFKRLADDPEKGFVAFVREKFDANIFSNSQLRAFALRYLQSRLSTDSRIDIDSIAASVIGSLNRFVPSVEVRERLAGYYRMFLVRWLRTREETLSQALAPVHEALQDALTTTPPPMSEETLVESALHLASSAQSMPEIERQEDSLILLRMLMDTSAAYETVHTHASRLFHSPAALAAREAYLKDIAKKNHELMRIADKAADIAQRSAELYIGWEPVANAGRSEPQEVIAAILRSIAIMSAGAAESFIHDSSRRLDELEVLERELIAANALPAKAEEFIAALGDAKSADVTRESIDSHLAAAGVHQSALSRVIAETHDAAALRLKELQAQKEAKIAIERAKTAMDAAHEVATEIAAALYEAGPLGRAVDEHALMADIVRGQLRQDEILLDSFRSAANEGASLASSGEVLSKRAGSLEQRLGRLVNESDRDDAILPARSALALLEGSGHGLTGEALDGAIESIAMLEEAIGKAEAAALSVGSFMDRVDATAKEIDDAIDEAAGRLPIAPEARITMLVERAEMPDSERSRPIFREDKPTSKPHAEAQKLLAGVLGGRLISMPMRGESRFIPAEAAARVEAWQGLGRAEDIKLVDAFGDEIVLGKGERGIRLVDRNELGEGSAYGLMLKGLNKVFFEASNEARLILLLAKNRHQALLNDLLAVLSSSAHESTESARAAVRGWALAHSSAIIAALGEDDAARFFEIGRAEKGARSKRGDASIAREVAPPSYKPADHAKYARSYSTLLSHPEHGKILIPSEGGTMRVRYCNLRHAETSIEGTRNNPDKKLQIMGFNADTCEMDEIFLYPGDVNLDEIRLIPSSVTRLTHLRTDRLLYKIYSDPALMDLGWLITEFKKVFNPLLDGFVDSLLLPLARAQEGKESPFTLRLAQTTAILVYRALMKTDQGLADTELLSVFTRQDPELARAHPETGMVAAEHRIAALGLLPDNSASETVKDMMKSFPEFSGALTIMDLAAANGEPPLSAEINDGLNALHTKYCVVSDPADAGIKKRFGREFRALYSRYADGALSPTRRFFGIEERPGQSYGLAVTGMNEPWSGEPAWEDFPPLTHLEIAAPVFGRVIEERASDEIANYRRKHDEQAKEKAQGSHGIWIETVESMVRYHPELTRPLSVVLCCHAHLAPKFQKIWATFFSESVWDMETKDVVTRRLVDTIIEPNMLRAIYEALQHTVRGAPEDTDTYAKALTDDETPPWLTSGSKPARSVPPKRIDDVIVDASVDEILLSSPKAEKYAELLRNPDEHMLASPTNLAQKRFAYRVLSDPSLAELSRILTSPRVTNDKTFRTLAVRMLIPLMPSELGLGGHTAPYSLHEVQQTL